MIGIMTSSFVGVVTFWLCQSAKIDQLYTAVCVAITGHMGAKGFELITAAVKRAFPGGQP